MDALLTIVSLRYGCESFSRGTPPLNNMERSGMLFNNSIRGISKQQLADEFSVSKRTIMRDVENLSISGFPVYDEIDMDREGQVFYYMWNKYKIPEISFSYSELLAFYLLYSIKKWLILYSSPNLVSSWQLNVQLNFSIQERIS